MTFTLELPDQYGYGRPPVACAGNTIATSICVVESALLEVVSSEEISKDFLVLAAATSTFFVTTAHFMRTAKLRKASGVAYPNAYASQEQADKNPAAHKFNCAQRAHANFTENHTALLGSLLIAGLRFPLVAASLGGLWSVARLAYLIGYTSDSGPKGRLVGSTFSFLADAVLKLAAAYTSYAIITEQ